MERALQVCKLSASILSCCIPAPPTAKTIHTCITFTEICLCPRLYPGYRMVASVLEGAPSDELLLTTHAGKRWDNIAQSGPFRVCRRYGRGSLSGLQRAATGLAAAWTQDALYEVHAKQAASPCAWLSLYGRAAAAAAARCCSVQNANLLRRAFALLSTLVGFLLLEVAPHIPIPCLSLALLEVLALGLC